MLVAPLFLCLGFMIAVLYIDLQFDLLAQPHRRAGGRLPTDVLESIATYYRCITKNPYLLMFVMLTTTICIVAEVVYALVPRWAGYSSLFLMGLAMSAGTFKVIPTAQRLAAGKDVLDEQTRMVHSIFPFHIVLLISILLLTIVQLATTLG
jgi:hypothetical protein